MAIKAGQILHRGNGFLIDRIQTGGTTNLNIPQEKIKELGNAKTVATIYDIPDLAFSMESFDTTCEVEALLLGLDPTALTSGQALDFTKALPLDVVSPFKSSLTNFNTVKGVALPYLTLESASYRFGVKANSSQTFGLKGDSVYYVPGTPSYEEFTVTSGANQSYALAHTALPYTESGSTIYILGACVKDVSSGLYKRLFIGDDFTNTSSGLTVLADWATAGYTKLHVVYGTATAENYPQSVHPTASVKPAAVRGKDIDVYISDGAATPTLIRWNGVQSVQFDWKVTLDSDEELGNSHYVTQDYDTPDVTGNITLKPADTADFMAKLQQIAGLSGTAIVGPYSTVPLEMEIRINHPDTGARLKTFYVSDARFTLPSFQGQVNQKSSVQMNWTSDEGNALVYNGSR